MDFLSEAKALSSELSALRRRLHQKPELAFQEFETSQFVAEELDKLGFSVVRGIGKTGVSGYLRGDAPKPLIMMRFDMDALPMQEESGADTRLRCLV